MMRSNSRERRTTIDRQRKRRRSITNSRTIRKGRRKAEKQRRHKGFRSSVSDKLIALKRLIPTQGDGEIVKADELFEETANYIVHLKAQVILLQGLLDLYGSNYEEKQIISSLPFFQ